MAGTWDGNITAAGSDSVLVNIELTATAEPTGWTMTVTNAKDPSMKAVVPLTSVVADGDSVVTDAGPFTSVLRAGQQVTTHGVYRLEGGQLVRNDHRDVSGHRRDDLHELRRDTEDAVDPLGAKTMRNANASGGRPEAFALRKPC